MTYQHFETTFRQKAANAGYSEENIQKCLDYARPLLEKQLPVVFNTSNLSVLVGYNKNYLKRAVYHTPFFYRTFKVKKKNGKIREITEPLPSLKEIQHWILNNILNHVQVSRYAKAYIKGRTLIDNTKFHKQKKFIITLDIENFFPSITINYVELIFSKCGYSSNISNLLAKLCCCNAVLPQGAPTSPTISNIFLYEFDELMFSYCKERNIRYTRYADDLCFSLTQEGEIDTLIHYTKNRLLEMGLKLNLSKTSIMSPNNRQIITGIVVNEKLQIPKYKRKKIRQEIYYISKYGLPNHLTHTKNLRANYLQHLLGKINFGLYINPNDSELKGYRKYISSILKEK